MHITQRSTTTSGSISSDIAPVKHRPRPLYHGGRSIVRIKTVPEFVAYAKANPGKVNAGIAGPGTTSPVVGCCSKRRRMSIAHGELSWRRAGVARS
jgi:hypothetical protein